MSEGRNETEIQVLKAVVEKLDGTLDRVVELTNDISKLLAVQEQRLSSVEKDTYEAKHDLRDLEKNIYSRLDEVVDSFHSIRDSLREEVKAEDKESYKKVKDLEERLASIEEWKWKVVGAVSVISFLAGILSKYIPNLLM